MLWDVDTASDETTLTEADSEFRSRASQIRQICTERSIITLVHFTRIENLWGILQEGLLSRSLLETRRPQLKFNDQKRLDEHRETICLSISFPNFQLFNKFSRPTENSPPNYSQWVVLLLKADLLWKLDCAFCQENAASTPVRRVSLEDRKKPNALESMFVDSYRDTNEKVYQRDFLGKQHPTHPQAEVLVFDQIQSSYIKEVHFYDGSALKTVGVITIHGLILKNFSITSNTSNMDGIR